MSMMMNLLLDRIGDFLAQRFAFEMEGELNIMVGLPSILLNTMVSILMTHFPQAAMGGGATKINVQQCEQEADAVAWISECTEAPGTTKLSYAENVSGVLARL
jgi:hypothetical protein